MNSTLIASYSIIALYCVLALTSLVGNFWVMLTVICQLMGYSSFPFHNVHAAVSGACGGGATTNGTAMSTNPNGNNNQNQNGNNNQNNNQNNNNNNKHRNQQQRLQHHHHHHRRRNTVSNVQFSACIYLLLLSIVDLISFVPVPLLAADIIENRWPFGLVLCKLLYTCEGANKSLSPLVLTALSVDRYVAVCRPNFIWLRQSRFALIVCCICAVLSSLFILPVTWRATVSQMPDNNLREHRKCVVEMDRRYDIIHTVACYLLPLTFICSVYVAILRRLYQHTRTVGPRTSISLSRVVKCSVLVVAFYFICWTPYWAMRIISIFSLDHSPTMGEFSSSSSLSGSPSIIHPAYAGHVDGLGDYTLSNANLTALFALWRDLHGTHSEFAIPAPNISAFLRNFENFAAVTSEEAAEDTTSASAGTPTAAAATNEDDFFTNVFEDYRHILLMYLVHALPYTQSAFNWLFYAFLNRNLRQSARFSQSSRFGGGAAPHAPPSIAVNNTGIHPTIDTMSQSATPQIGVRTSSNNYHQQHPLMMATSAAARCGNNKIFPFWLRINFSRWRTKELCYEVKSTTTSATIAIDITPKEREFETTAEEEEKKFFLYKNSSTSFNDDEIINQCVIATAAPTDDDDEPEKEKKEDSEALKIPNGLVHIHYNSEMTDTISGGADGSEVEWL